jgi:PTH1 family peptidyl-tRNA hydrolase
VKLIVGLGNPGKKYTNTKHNVGFMCLDKYAHKYNLTFKKENKFNAELVKVDSLLLLKPHTFMNLSGQSIKAIVDYYDIDVDDILIIYDDLSLPLGKIRLREKGSAGGHNGIKSVISHLGTQEFKRIKVGIDSNPLIDTKDYVLGTFTKKQLEELSLKFNQVVDIMDSFKKNLNFNQIMNENN